MKTINMIQTSPLTWRNTPPKKLKPFVTTIEPAAEIEVLAPRDLTAEKLTLALTLISTIFALLAG